MFSKIAHRHVREWILPRLRKVPLRQFPAHAATREVATKQRILLPWCGFSSFGCCIVETPQRSGCTCDGSPTVSEHLIDDQIHAYPLTTSNLTTMPFTSKRGQDDDHDAEMIISLCEKIIQQHSSLGPASPLSNSMIAGLSSRGYQRKGEAQRRNEIQEADGSCMAGARYLSREWRKGCNVGFKSYSRCA